MKELKLRPQTDKHDLETKSNKVKNWLKKGERVKITVRFKGRQHKFMDSSGPKTISNFLSYIDQYKVVNEPKNTGRLYIAVIDPKK